MRVPTLYQVKRAQHSTPWDFGNTVLYNLCKDNFQHDKDEVIIAKVLMIGRVYAAAVERRRTKESISDDFYIEKVAPTIRTSKLDDYLTKLGQADVLKLENVGEVLKVHHYLIALLSSITGLEKRSFCSKYLHFHLPNIFLIYDSRVVTSLRHFVGKVPKPFEHWLRLEGVDTEYSKFVCKALCLRTLISNRYGILLTNRQLDNLLIDVANRRNRKKAV